MPKIDVKEKLEGNEIDLSLCNLVSIPVEELACFTDATCLDLSHNMIASIPPSFCTLTHLVRIDLSHNQLSDLPADFGDLVNLQHLDLRSNQLTTLPTSFRHLHGLRWLDLGSNPLIPAMRERAGDCHNERECQLCAKNVVAYMKEAAEKANREDLIQRKNGAYQLLYRFLRIPYMAVLVLVLAGGTVWYGGTRIKDNLYHNALVPACNQLRDGVFVSARLAGHVWQCFISIFRSGHKAFAKGDGVCT